MISVRPAAERGHANFGWLDAHHSFSFGQYHDPRFMGYRALRVINEDRIAEGGGFPTHPHRDMEIFTLVISGALAHQDSMGNGTTILPDEVQVMSAGTGIRHSEFNAAKGPTHLLQMWIEPGEAGLAPRYGQKAFPREARLNQLKLVLSPGEEDGALKLFQDAKVLLGAAEAGKSATYKTSEARYLWAQIVRGSGTINGTTYQAGDGLALWKVSEAKVEAAQETDLVLFDLA